MPLPIIPHGGLQFNQYTQTYEQGYRVADTAYELYELYVGEDASPDFSDSTQPVATSATLPFSWTPTPPGAGTKELHCVVRQRNAYNLVGFNVGETVLEIDTLSAAVLGPVTAPTDLSVYDASSSGSAKVLATYNNDDDTNPADTYEVYAKEGSAPTVGVDSPAATGTLVFLGNTAVIDVTITGYTPSATLYVIVSAVRASDTERGSTAAATLVLAASLDLTEGQAFGNSTYESR